MSWEKLEKSLAFSQILQKLFLQKLNGSFEKAPESSNLPIIIIPQTDTLRNPRTSPTTHLKNTKQIRENPPRRKIPPKNFFSLLSFRQRVKS
jgi:hypothetical protein